MNVGLIGIGTVGGGTYKVLTENFQEIFNKIGIEIKVTHVADKDVDLAKKTVDKSVKICLLYTSPSPRDGLLSRMPSSA